MTDVNGELHAEGEADGPRASRSGRRAVALLALAAIALAVLAGALMGGRGGEVLPAGGGRADPSAVLDAALTAGTPVYLLIHSET